MGQVANKRLGGLLVAAGLALAATSAGATDYYNLTGQGAYNPLQTSNTSATIGSGLFTSGVDGTVVGTGVLNPFVRIQQTGNGNCPSSDVCIESGYNTDSQNEQFETKDNGGTNWDHSLRLGDLNQVCISGKCYYQFVLDINERSGQGDQFLSLDKFQIYTSALNNLDNFTESSPDCLYPTNQPPQPCAPEGFGASASKIYDIDTGVDASIGLDYSLNSGSGKGIDMYAYVDASLFGNDPNAFVYLYSSFGATGTINNGERTNSSGQVQPPNGPVAGLLPDGNYAQSAGFEEWATKLRRVPEPMSTSLFLIGLAALAFTQRRQIRQFAPAS